MEEYHVAINGDDRNEGSVQAPFRTISKAAQVAEAGSKVIVHEGEYREWVKPEHRGYSDIERIIYEAAEGENVVIKGSERVENWQLVQGTVWKTVIPNVIFGRYNPYKVVLEGDWFCFPQDYKVHAGEVYLNGKSFYEAESLEKVYEAKVRYKGFAWTEEEELLFPQDSIYQWYAEVEEENTVIYANFQGYDPNQEFTEINVRQCCFYPEKTGRDYITVRGFEMCQAACPFVPPTADQIGLLGTNWSKGWVIENNVIHDAKCSGISIGKNELVGGDNLSAKQHRKSAHQYQLEAVFHALQNGWRKERIGSHVVRHNKIFNCGQNGIVGHLGGIFSEIMDNDIFNIGIKYEYFGYEIAGIKLHAAIDVQIIHNHIHDCSLGIWLDWEAQGTRVSKNLFHSNSKDLMIEVSHGPYIVDNNVFASKFNINNVSQGGAFIHNLYMGTQTKTSVLNRTTPYHYPHSTEVAGYSVVYGGDDRFYQNIFIGKNEKKSEKSFYGTSGYQECPASLETYIEKVINLGTHFDEETVLLAEQPAYIDGNVYLGIKESYTQENHYYRSEENVDIQLQQEDSKIYLMIKVPEKMLEVQTKLISTNDLGAPRLTEALYENPDGTVLLFKDDFNGTKRKEKPIPGPFENLHKGENKIRVW